MSAAESSSRHQLGQWFTPQPVAQLALGLATRGCTRGSILDPSCGDGVFLLLANQQGFDPQNTYGVDVDPRAISLAKTRGVSARLQCADFLANPELPRVDFVVGNPPYVRQERVDKAAKNAIVAKLASELPGHSKAIASLVGRSDLAGPFLLRSLLQLKAGGRAAVILSTAFLDAKYGEDFFSLAASFVSVEKLVDAPGEKWFADAAIHPMIVVFARPQDASDLAAPTEVVRLQKPVAEIAMSSEGDIFLPENGRCRQVSSRSTGSYREALRATDAWLAWKELAGDALCRLDELCEVHRGLTSGANDIFYFTREEKIHSKIPEEFFAPLLRTPSHQPGILAQSSSYLLAIAPETDLGAHKSLRDHLEKFPDACQRATLRSRTPWWSLRPRQGQVFLCKAYNQRFVQPYSPVPMVADQRLSVLTPRAGIDPLVLAAVVNSTFTALALESLGRASMGQGALEWSIADMRSLPVLDVRGKAIAGLAENFEQLCARPLRDVHKEAGRSDRVRLDEILASPWPHLRTAMAELQHALSEACADRVGRSLSPSL